MSNSNRRSLQIHIDFDPSPVLSTTVLVNGQPSARALISGDEFAQPWLPAFMAIARATYSHPSATPGDAGMIDDQITSPTPFQSTQPSVPPAPAPIQTIPPAAPMVAPPTAPSDDRPTKRTRRSPSISTEATTASAVDSNESIQDRTGKPTSIPPKSDLPSRRMAKLKALLVGLGNYRPGNNLEHSELVRQVSTPEGDQPAVGSMKQVGRLLSRMGSRSVTAGIIYILLSWNIFREEEQDLVLTKHVSPPIAAKEVSLRLDIYVLLLTGWTR